MTIYVAISEAFLKEGLYALCSLLRKEVVRCNQPDDKSFTGWRGIYSILNVLTIENLCLLKQQRKDRFVFLPSIRQET